MAKQKQAARAANPFHSCGHCNNGQVLIDGETGEDLDLTRRDHWTRPRAMRECECKKRWRASNTQVADQKARAAGQ